MRGISIRRPWSWAICLRAEDTLRPKRCENRAWLESRGLLAQALALVGKTILIHAAKGCTLDEYEEAGEWMIDQGLVVGHGGTPPAEWLNKPGLVVPPLAELPRGAIVARAKLVDVVRTDEMGHRWPIEQKRSTTCALCGTQRTVAARFLKCSHADPWAIQGQVGLVLDDVDPLKKPLPYKGSLGFFEVDDNWLLEATRGAA